MTMQRSIGFGAGINTNRALAAMGRAQEKARIMDTNLKAAAREPAHEGEKRRWYCLSVDKGCEFSVEDLLTKAEIESMVPRERVYGVVRKGRTMKAFDRPFLPDYVMVRCVPSAEAFQGLRAVKHVRGVVGGMENPHVINDNHLLIFKAFADGAPVPRVATDKSMQEGDRVDIVDGPFTGFSGLVLAVKWSKQARARIRIKANGEDFEVASMPLAFLKKL